MDPYLYEAATLGDVSFLRRIRDGDVLSNHDLLLQKTPKDNNILHIAAEFRQIEFFRQVPHHYSPALFWAANKKGDTPLHVAARVGCEEIVDFLIDQARALHIGGADEEIGQRKPLLRVTNMEMDTALHVAVRYGHLGVVVMLMEADSELSCLTNRADESVLFLAARKGSAEIALYLLNKSPVCPCFRGTNGVTALHAAVTRSNLTSKGIVRTMVSRNPDMIKTVDALGWTPLHYAAFRGNLEATRVLLQCDSSASYILDNSGMSAFHVAAHAGHTKIMEELLRWRPDICDLLNNKGQTALHAAVLGERVNVVEYILKTPKLAAIINEADNDGNTPLHLAALQQNHKIIKVLSGDRRVDMIAINKEFSKPIDMFLGDNVGEQETIRSGMVLHNLGCSVGVPFFQQQVSRDFDKLDSLDKASGLDKTRENQQKAPPDDRNALKRNDTKLLVATLIATITFAASFTNVPGGFKDDGMPVLYEKATFKVFQFFNAVSFYISILAIYNESTPITVLSIHLPTPSSLIQYSIAGMVVAFFSGMLAVQPRHYDGNVLEFLFGTSSVDILLAVICGILLILAIIPVLKSLIQISRGQRIHWLRNRVI
ncbi:ankyrin repeat-containing protein At5g02620-like [Argentina anserina]|uniref:ankyrin repeat-containing protein At5g02620-like n=1 Tax=Argentina anserina TaxID=57926 RepID=UPI0021764A97|nr:ankyrin repeat-containing protein At5g02620-like [Potentilla anserina]